MTQSNTQLGSLVRKAIHPYDGQFTPTTNLAGLVAIAEKQPGTPSVRPGNVGSFPHYMITDGPDANGKVTVEPLCSNRQYRARLVGTCQHGDELIVAGGSAPDPESDGRVIVMPAEPDPGIYKVFAIAEEDGVDGQHVLIRPINPHTIVVPEPEPEPEE